MILDHIFADFLNITANAVAICHAEDPKEYSNIIWVNEAFCKNFETTEECAIGKSPSDFIDPDYVDDLWQTIQEKLGEGKNDFALDTSCLTKNRKTFWANISFLNVPDDKGGRYTILDVREMNDLKNREQAAEIALIEHELLFFNMEALKARLETAINAIPDPFAIYSKKEKLMVWNPAYEQNGKGEGLGLKEGMKADEVLRLGIAAGRFPDAIGREDEWIAEILEPFRTLKSHTFHMVAEDHQYRVQQFTAENGDKLVLRTDVTEITRQQAKLASYADQLEQANKDMSHQALHDELTGLGNRRYLSQKFDELVKYRRKHGGQIASLHIDLDRFKQINDTMGHAAGDYVLERVAERLHRCVRGNDVIARIGGDEFIVLVNFRDDADLPARLADRLVREVGKPLVFEDRPCRFGVSIGIAQTPLIDASELLTSSDVALYKAKDGGRARAVSFDQRDLDKMIETKRLSDDILRGLEKKEFVPYFQPLVHYETLTIIGFEVLARWDHPTLGILAPATFLPTATEMQLESQIDSMIFKKALAAFGSEFGDRRDVPKLSFNVSLARLMDADLVTDVHTRVYQGQISLELLETIFFEEESEEVMMRIDTLRDMGLTFEVDDFGSGRASIIALQRLAPTRLKIDGRLIAPMTESESARKLVTSIVEIGQALGIGVTAEGVETKEQAQLLGQTACDIQQGYFFARPSPFEEAIALLGNNTAEKQTA